MTIAGDSDAAQLTGDVEFQLTDSTISFYYLATRALTRPSLIIQISASAGSSFDISYIAIVLIIMISLVVLYGLISCVRYCLQGRSAQVLTQFQSREWLEHANDRYENILGESSEGTYEIAANKFAQAACSICLVEFEDKCPIRKLICSHIFHKACIETWIKAKINAIPRCPMCNAELTHERPPGFVEEVRINVNPAPTNPNNGINVEAIGNNNVRNDAPPDASLNGQYVEVSHRSARPIQVNE